MYNFVVLLWFWVFESYINVYHLGQTAHGQTSPKGDSKPWSVFAFLWTSTSLEFRIGEEGIEIPTPGTSAHCPHITFAFFLSSRTTRVWKHHQLCSLSLSLFLLLLKVSCWTQSKGLDKQLSPWTHINMKISALLSQVNIILQGLPGVAQPLGSASQILLCMLITHGSY